MYIEEGQLLLYIYFYIFVKVEKRKNLLEAYGNIVFQYLTKITHDNYDMKELACELMNSKFS